MGLDRGALGPARPIHSKPLRLTQPAMEGPFGLTRWVGCRMIDWRGIVSHCGGRAPLFFCCLSRRDPDRDPC